MLENGFLSTGDLVKILGTTKNTLFHYDAMGLFSPAMVKENGYRAYSYRQLETFRAISSLRELGMSLREIKDYMQNRNPERLCHLLQTQLSGIQEEITKLQQIEKFLHHHIACLEDLKSLDLDAITIVNQEEETLYCSLLSMSRMKKARCFTWESFAQSPSILKVWGLFSPWMRFFKNITIISTVFSAQLIRITPTESV